MSVTDSVSDRPEILSVNLRIFTRQSYNIGHVLTTSVLAIRVAFVWETPVRVGGSEVLWREAILASRQASFTSFFNKENKLQLSGRRA